MTQEIKDTAKRFFYLLYLFLQRSYTKIEVVFIRHHTKAEEVSEEDFSTPVKPVEQWYQALWT